MLGTQTEFVTTDKVTMKLDGGCLMIRLVFRAKIGVCLGGGPGVCSVNLIKIHLLATNSQGHFLNWKSPVLIVFQCGEYLFHSHGNKIYSSSFSNV